MSKPSVGAQGRTGGRSNGQIIGSIADRTRREALLVVRGRTTHVGIEELATHVAAAVSGTDLVEVTREQRDRRRLELANLHLPKLAEGGLVEWDAEDGTVAPGDHPVLEDQRFRDLLDVDADDWDRVLGSLRSERRRALLAILASADELDRRDLARRLVAREHDVAPTTVPGRETESALVSLHHLHVPALREAGLVEYDDGTVRYVGHPELDPEAVTDLPRADDDDRDLEEDADIRTIDGTSDIVARGQGLFEDADEELFLMVTTDGLLEDGCVTRLQDAAARGVDIYVGSQTANVRDLVREEVPEATIWEPQLDWLNFPANHEKLGRLVFADREAVMIGTLGEGSDGDYDETAITGEGQDNSLVVLLREMLGSRLDHLDAQSEDFLSQIPL